MSYTLPAGGSEYNAVGQGLVQSMQNLYCRSEQHFCTRFTPGHAQPMEADKRVVDVVRFVDVKSIFYVFFL